MLTSSCECVHFGIQITTGGCRSQLHDDFAGRKSKGVGLAGSCHCSHMAPRMLTHQALQSLAQPARMARF